MADLAAILTPATCIALCALGVAVWQARCSTKAQLISQRNLELQEQGAHLAMMDSQYGQHLTNHQAAIDQLRIDVAVLKEHVRSENDRIRRLGEPRV
jgi:hypothetical protein